MNLNEIHRDPTGQVALYQTEDRYLNLLERRFGQRFPDYRRRWRETSERGDPGLFPLSLDLAINSGCQLKCLMCPLHSYLGRRQVKMMEPDLFELLMAQAEEHRLPALTLGLASEPLLNPQAPAWIARAAKAGVMDIRLGSNGLALDENVVKALVASGLTRLEISVDAVRPETYRAVRGGDLDRLERAVDRFLEIRAQIGEEMPLLRLSFLRLEINRGELNAFLQRWQGRADMIAIQEPIWFPGSALPPPAEPGRLMAPVCAQSWQRLAVDHDGRLWPCCSWHGEKLLPFNARDISLADAWRSPEMESLRAALAGSLENIPPACRRCEF